MTVAQLRAALEGIDDNMVIVIRDTLKIAKWKPIEDVHVFDMTYLGAGIYTSRGEPGEPEQAVVIQ